MKALYGYLQGIKGILLILYVQFIISADIYLSDLSDHVKIGLYLLTFIALVLLCPLLIRLLRRISIRHSDILTTRKRRVICFFVFLSVTLTVLMAYYIAFWPGGFTADSVNQYQQALSGSYNDWHPYLHTIIAFTIPLKLTGGWSGSVILFQEIAFAFALAYSAHTVFRHSNLGYAVGMLMFVLLNPVTAYMSVYAWKDAYFAIVTLVLSAYAANTYFTKGAWLKKLPHIAAVLVFLTLASVLRHNGVFFTLPMLLAMALYLNRRGALALLACFMTMFLVVKIPLAATLGVEKPGGRTEEALGLPMTVIGEVAARKPEVMSDEMRSFVYEVAPQYYWEDYYLTGGFNSIKFYPETDYYRIDEEGAFKVLGYMAECFIKAPKESARSLLTLTDMVYTVTADADWENTLYPLVISNDAGIVSAQNSDLLGVLSFFFRVGNKWLERIFWCIGTVDLVLIACMLSRLSFRKRSEWKRILMPLSLLLYNAGTMLMLSGTEFRFFFLTFVVSPVLLLIVLRDADADKTSEDSAEDVQEIITEQDPEPAAAIE